MRILKFLIFIFKPESSILDPTLGHNVMFQQTYFHHDGPSVAGIVKVIVWVILAIVAALGLGSL